MEENILLKKIEQNISSSYYSYSSDIKTSIKSAIEANKFDTALNIYKKYHMSNNKCGFHCSCGYTLLRTLNNPKDINFEMKIINHFLDYSSKNSKLYDQIDDLKLFSEYISKNRLLFNNIKINEISSKIKNKNIYYIIFEICIFCQNIGQIFEPDLFENRPERVYD